jgi:hypothetical protein
MMDTIVSIRASVPGTSNDRNFVPLRHRVQTDSGAHQATYPRIQRASAARIKRPGLESDHSHPSGAQVKNAWSYTSTPPILLETSQVINIS